MPKLYTGVLERWSSSKGFGFIRPDDGGEDVFCHVTELAHKDDKLHNGDILEFEIIEEKRRRGKPRAIYIEIKEAGRGGSRSRSRSRGGRGGGGRRQRYRSHSTCFFLH